MTQTFPDITATIADEQHFFDAVRAIREDARETRANAWQSAGNTKDRARLKANAESDDTLGSPDDAVAFLRIDTDDECLYVGEHSVSDPSSDRLVYSWRAPAILRLRGATHDDPRGVVRKRTFSVAPINSIHDLDDLVLAELARQVAQLGTTEPERLGSDEFLQNVLARGRTPEMQTIVQTIQAAQADIIAMPAERLLVVQGGPGTGKTAVALHRVAALLFGELRDRPNAEVLVVGPNVTFLRYIARVLPELGEQSVRQSDIGRLMNANVSVNVSEQPAAAHLKGDERMVELLARGLSDRLRPPPEPMDFSLENTSFKVTLSASDLTEILDSIESAHYNVGRQRFRATIENRIVTLARRRQKADGQSRAEAPRARPAEIDAAVERIWPQLTPAAFLRDLFGSLERLLSAAGSTLTAEQVRLLRRQSAPRLAEQLWSKEDLPLLDHVAWEMSGDVDRTYAHIVADEAQDLSPMQLLALRRRSETGAMTIVGDIAQSTGHWARDSWDDIVDHLASPLPRETVQLEYGYRVPRGVMDVAGRLLPLAAPGIRPPDVVRDVERGPQWHTVAGDDDHYARVVQVVREHSSNGLFVGVICPDAGRQPLEAAFRAAGMQWNNADAGGLAAAINVVNPVASKGLEFDAVVVVDPQTIVEAGPQGLRMLYIALTRTTGYLDVVFPEGQLPAALHGHTGGEHRAVPAAGLASTGGSVEVDAGTEQTPRATTDASGHLADSHTHSPHEPSAVAGGISRKERRSRPSTPAGSLRARSVRFHSDAVLEMLREVAPPHLWREILEEACSSIDDGDGETSD